MAALIAAGIGAASSYIGGKKDQEMASRMKHSRERALKRMQKYWKKAYEASQGEFNQARQDILGQGQANMGNLTAGMASGGLLNTTVASNMGRGVMSSTQQQLGQLGAQRASSAYAKWMDRADIGGQTPYDNFSPSSQAESWGQAGADIGSMISGSDWGGLFGVKTKKT